MVTVTCVGIAVQDMVFTLVEPARLGAKNLATSVQIVGGGPAANAAVTVAALGGQARLVSKLGADLIGNSIIADLAAAGVDVSLIRRLSDVSSPLSSVAVDATGERTIINHTDARLIDGSDTINASELVGSDALLVDLRWPAGARAGIGIANDLGIPSVVDFDLTTADAPEEIVAAASHVVFSEPALAKLTGIDDPDGALLAVSATTDAFVAVTLGADGLKWVNEGAVTAMAAFPISVVDTLGAGDVFHGAFAYGIARRLAIPEALRLASATSAIKCSRAGGRAGIPTLDEVDGFLNGDP